MGVSKRALEDLQDQQNIGLAIAVEAGCLEECERHEGTYIDAGIGLEDAFKLGNYKMSNGLLDGHFETRREMTDAVQAAFEHHAVGECYGCVRIEDE